jgi:hypothetical protein
MEMKSPPLERAARLKDRGKSLTKATVAAMSRLVITEKLC